LSNFITDQSTTATDIEYTGFNYVATGGAWVTVAGGPGFTITLSASHRVLITASMNTPGNASMWARLLIDGAPIADPNLDGGYGPIGALFSVGPSSSFTYATTLSGGTHNFTLQAETLCAGCSGPHAFFVYGRSLVVMDAGS